MDIKYCMHECPIGCAKSEELLTKNNSVFDAVSDFRLFVEKCFETCLHKDKHVEEKK
jgi:hypothetical protein